MNIICNVILNPLILGCLDSYGRNGHIVKLVEEKDVFPSKVLIITFVFLFSYSVAYVKKGSQDLISHLGNFLIS